MTLPLSCFLHSIRNFFYLCSPHRIHCYAPPIQNSEYIDIHERWSQYVLTQLCTQTFGTVRVVFCGLFLFSEPVMFCLTSHSHPDQQGVQGFPLTLLEYMSSSVLDSILLRAALIYNRSSMASNRVNVYLTHVRFLMIILDSLGLFALSPS